MAYRFCSNKRKAHKTIDFTSFSHFPYLGQLDSNQRMQESKSCALPLGDGPKNLDKKKFPYGKGEYRDSNPGPPEPQSGAITNFAIPTIVNFRLGLKFKRA